MDPIEHFKNQISHVYVSLVKLIMFTILQISCIAENRKQTEADDKMDCIPMVYTSLMNESVGVLI